jgi:hypothetical protein
MNSIIDHQKDCLELMMFKEHLIILNLYKIPVSHAPFDEQKWYEMMASQTLQFINSTEE